MDELTDDGHFKLAKEYQVFRPDHAYTTASECIESLVSLQNHLDKSFLIDMLSSLKDQIDAAIADI